MENLATLRLSGNPLRDKKFCSMNTDQMKGVLAARLEPAPVHDHLEAPPNAPIDETDIGRALGQPGRTTSSKEDIVNDDYDSRSDLDDFATPPTSAPHICSKLAASNTVREIQLHHNLFTVLPDSLSFFAKTLTSLSLAHNKLVGETYLGGLSGNEDLDLPALKELNLASNHMTSLAPLSLHLRAPRLQKLDVSFNRITAMPQGALCAVFPQLAVLIASNNHLIDLDPETIKGLRIVDVGNNDIAHLNPRLGLLGGSGGMERLVVSGNRFRVPRWNVLERGTDATLRWLRSRVPVAEMAAWEADGGVDGDEDLETHMADLD